MVDSTIFCLECGSDDVFHERGRVVVEIKGRRVTVEDDCHVRCRQCDSISYPGVMADEHMTAVSARLRQEDGLLSVAELKEIRLRYGLLQEEMEALIGSGPKTWVRWERGRITPSPAYDRAIRRIAEDPRFLRRLMLERGIDNPTAFGVIEDAFEREVRDVSREMSILVDGRDRNEVEAIVATALSRSDELRNDLFRVRKAEVDVESTIARAMTRIPVDVEGLARDLGMPVVRDPRMSRQSSGSIMREAIPSGASGYRITVNGSEAHNRQRFTIAHEIAHLLLHRNRIGDGITEQVLHRSFDSNDVIEREANSKAAEILMPESFVRDEFQRDRDPDSLARRFKVSSEAMGWRLYNLGLVHSKPRRQ